MSSNDANLNPEEVKQRILLLDVRPKDLEGCHSIDQEFTVILRKTSDMKAFADPSETGFAGRIREINKAHRSLKKLYNDRQVDSFAQFFDGAGSD